MSRAVRLEAGVLQAAFERRGDRFRHVVEIHGKDGLLVLLESLEGTGDEHFPPSPALSDLHIEARKQGVQAALLLGMAGSSHWSASVEADPRTSRITFDVACRLAQPPVWLGSTYRWGPAAGLDGNNAAGGPGSGWKILVDAIDGGLPADRRFVEDGVVIAPAQENLAFPCTVRWRYSIAPPHDNLPR